MLPLTWEEIQPSLFAELAIPYSIPTLEFDQHPLQRQDPGKSLFPLLTLPERAAITDEGSSPRQGIALGKSNGLADPENTSLSGFRR